MIALRPAALSANPLPGQFHLIILGMLRLRLLYAFASTLWLAYYIRSFLAIPLDQRSPHYVRSFFLCLLILVIVPVSVGYLLLFRLAPWITRRMNPAR